MLNVKLIKIVSVYIVVMATAMVFTHHVHAGSLVEIETNCQCGTVLRLHAEFSGTPLTKENYKVNSTFSLDNNPSCVNPDDTGAETVPIEHYDSVLGKWVEGYDASGRGWIDSRNTYYSPGACVWKEYTSWVIKDSNGNTVKNGDTSSICSDCQNSAPTCKSPIPNPDKDSYGPGETISLKSDATDKDGDALSYEWSASAGSLATPRSEDTDYTFPNAYDVSSVIKYKVTDTHGAYAECQTTLNTSEEPQAFCGDGIINGNEECDDGEQNGNVCTPTSENSCTYCSDTCTLITVNSTGPEPYCGDGIVNNNEACDNGEQNGKTCSPEYGETCTYCNSDCSELITVNGGYCGDGYVDEPQEECDDKESNGNTCIPPKDSSCTYCSDDCKNVTVASNPDASACNESCVDNTDCDSGLVCSGNVCRNNSCLSDIDCVCDNNAVDTQIIVNTNLASDNTCVSDIGMLGDVDVTLQSDSSSNKYNAKSSPTEGKAVFDNVPYDTYTISAKKEEYISCESSVSVTVDPSNLKQEENMSLFKSEPNTWLSCSQGNFTMLTDLNEKMPSSGALIDLDGTIMIDGSIDLKDGEYGNNTYVFSPYNNGDNAFFNTVFAKITESNNDVYFVQGDYEVKNSNSSDTEFSLPGTKTILVVGGDLVVDYNIDKINATIIVNGDATFRSEDDSDSSVVDDDLMINGNLLVHENIIQKRKSHIEVKGTYEFLNLGDDFNFNIFREYKRYTE